ncbi:ATP-binding protein [Deferrisoma palaeochoriense]
MKRLVVISGKGGTGKTSLVGAFAALSENKILVDCDVDAADLHLILGPRQESRHEFVGGKKASIRSDACTGCGQCHEACRFDAIRPDGDRYRVDPYACEGCGLCWRLCPSGAVAFEPAVSGEWYVSATRHGPLVHARLGIAEGNSGKLVTQLRQEADRIAEARGLELVIVDGAPGVGCPVIASLSGASHAVIVTEPTVSGLHDLRRVAALADQLGVPATVCVNKWDLNPDLTEEAERWAGENGLTIGGRIRYDPGVIDAQVAQTTVPEHASGPLRDDFCACWEAVRGVLGIG